MACRKTFIIAGLMLLSARLASHPGPKTAPAGANGPERIYTATRLAGEKPRIDGAPDEACWEAGDWSCAFTQWTPDEGALPSQKTDFKILFDDTALYVAIRAFDTEPDKIQRKAGRRDEFAGDMVGITLDSYHDHRTGFEFDMTAAGQKIDLILTNPVETDMNWDAVWSGEAAFNASGWTVEMAIPFSQLRFGGGDEQVWGLHCWRWIARLQEESDWDILSNTGPGILYQFGELRGIRGIRKSRRVEIVPYLSGKLDAFRAEPLNPFADKGRSFGANGGGDAKIGLSSNFTLDMTVNPDFGQVESDPSVMNLTAFETLYEEKRPFFLEGKSIFDFDLGDSDDILFYSRRIGHAPTHEATAGDGEFTRSPEATTILSALKLSGKTAGGLSVGILHSFTAAESADISGPGGLRSAGVEPFSSYFVARAQQDFNGSNTVVGGIFTAVNRSLRDAGLRDLARSSYTGGLDLLHQWNDKAYYVKANVVASDVRGGTEAITALQRSSARYFQRPGAGHLTYDETRTGLSGHGGKVKVGRGAKGLWRYSAEVAWRSPGLELNDLGYMTTADFVRQAASVSYFVINPVSIFRTYSLGFTQYNLWDSGFNYLSSGATLSLSAEFLNKWRFQSTISGVTKALDTRLLRGGLALEVPASWTAAFRIATDSSRRAYFSFDSTLSGAEDGRARGWSVAPNASFRPANALRISAGVGYYSRFDEIQFVGTAAAGPDTRSLLGRIDQETLELALRIDYSITPDLSVQYYGSPFASIGGYSDLKGVVDPRADVFRDRFAVLGGRPGPGGWLIDENGDSIVDYAVADPGFGFYQFRSNLVLRWEFRPGSRIYAVWSSDRTDYGEAGSGRFEDLAGKLGAVHPDDIFMVKFSYWFSL